MNALAVVTTTPVITSKIEAVITTTSTFVMNAPVVVRNVGVVVTNPEGVVITGSLVARNAQVVVFHVYILSNTNLRCIRLIKSQ